MDHLLGHARGGLTQPTNLVAACATCNNARGDQPLEEWLKEYPAAYEYPVTELYLDSGGTAIHQAEMDAVFSCGVPDPSLCSSGHDANRWLQLYCKHNQAGWTRLIHGDV